MTTEEKLDLLAEVFDMDASELKPEMKLDDIENWDSMTKLSLIVCFDENFGKKITQSDFKKFVTVSDILAEMERETFLSARN